jgi:hypothetical protein
VLISIRLPCGFLSRIEPIGSFFLKIYIYDLVELGSFVRSMIPYNDYIYQSSSSRISSRISSGGNHNNII